MMIRTEGKPVAACVAVAVIVSGIWTPFGIEAWAQDEGVGSNAAKRDWPQFRGPGGRATSHDEGLPVTWSSTENIAWKTKLPGPGTSSPITSGNRVYLTCYSGYGLKPNEGDMNDLMRHVLCVDRRTGRILWTRDFKAVLPETKYAGGNYSRHGYSSSTPTTDGERLYVFFGKSGVYCLDLDGNELWHAKVGSRHHGWGSASSAVLHDDLVIINASVESESLVALNKVTGEEVWRAGNIRSSWSTPVVVDAPDGKPELVLNETEAVIGFDPSTGKELWRVGASQQYVCTSVVAHDGIVYALRRGSLSLAIRAGGRGDVAETHVLWRRRGRGSLVPSPVYHDSHVYWVSGGGAVFCLSAADGQTVSGGRRAPRPDVIYASLIAADGKLYCVTQHDGTYVLAAGSKFEQLAHNVFEDDNSRTNASPIVSNGQLLMRTDRYLYCIGTRR